MTKLQPFYRRDCGYVGRGYQLVCPKCGKKGYSWGPPMAERCSQKEIRPEDDIRALMEVSRESVGFMRDRLRKAEEKVQKAEKDIILATKQLLTGETVHIVGAVTFGVSPEMLRVRLENAQKRLKTWSLRRDRLQRRLSAIDANNPDEATEETSTPTT